MGNGPGIARHVCGAVRETVLGFASAVCGAGLLAAGLLAAPAAAAVELAAEVRFPAAEERRSGSQPPGGLYSRCRARWGGLELLLISRPSPDPGRPADLSAGLVCPLLLAGPVRPAGLLRQAGLPLGHGPGSDVFREQTGFHLDGSLYEPGRSGLLVSPLPGRAGVFLWEGEGEAPRLGGLFALETAGGGPGRACLEALALSSAPPKPAAEPQEWFLPRRRYPGGRLLHLGGRLLAADGAADFCGTFLLSGGEKVTPGALVQAQARLGSQPAPSSPAGALSLELLAGGCSAAYRTPEGRPAARRLLAGARVGLRRRRPAGRIAEAGLELGGLGALEHPPRELFPAAEPVLPAGSRELELRGALELRLRGRPSPLRLRLEGEARGEARSGEEGRRETGGALDLQAALEGRGFRLLARGGFSRPAGDDPAGLCRRLRLEGEWQRGPARLRLELGREEGLYSLRLALDGESRGGTAGARGGRLRVEAGLSGLDLSAGMPAAQELGRRLEARLGWEVRR